MDTAPQMPTNGGPRMGLRDWLMKPAWRSAMIVDDVPDGAQFVGYDLYGWKYYRDGKRIVAIHN